MGSPKPISNYLVLEFEEEEKIETANRSTEMAGSSETGKEKGVVKDLEVLKEVRKDLNK